MNVKRKTLEQLCTRALPALVIPYSKLRCDRQALESRSQATSTNPDLGFWRLLTLLHI